MPLGHPHWPDSSAGALDGPAAGRCRGWLSTRCPHCEICHRVDACPCKFQHGQGVVGKVPFHCWVQELILCGRSLLRLYEHMRVRQQLATERHDLLGSAARGKPAYHVSNCAHLIACLDVTNADGRLGVDNRLEHGHRRFPKRAVEFLVGSRHSIPPNQPRTLLPSSSVALPTKHRSLCVSMYQPSL